MELCSWAEVEVYPADTRVGPKYQIFPLMVQGEGTMVKSKNKKIDLGKFVQVEEDSPIPLVLWTFEYLASEFKKVKEILMKLPQGTGDSSYGHVSYVTQHELDAYLRDQRT
ncbi:hypothetical protein KY290_021395 [Solanum tuberosum]|uniref:Uncharacterized protein n=1 Tax=Solanum tuberosum TaxID=4113 RepID=A0ABQ7V1H2_SOLTU|nr:hypothetical protein KY289_020560 [Solanum tuberosum]KAH0693227.1 hypothetical protein KY285_020324 [Solanum tuberosum]KAH0757902.1 hypothetical protein KY290_021395 [Solanum tuberosum]